VGLRAAMTAPISPSECRHMDPSGCFRGLSGSCSVQSGLRVRCGLGGCQPVHPINPGMQAGPSPIYFSTHQICRALFDLTARYAVRRFKTGFSCAWILDWGILDVFSQCFSFLGPLFDPKGPTSPISEWRRQTNRDFPHLRTPSHTGSESVCDGYRCSTSH
jgi:hypothetical protein